MVLARLVVLACLACFAWGCAETQHPGDDSASSDDAPRNTRHRKPKKKKKKKVAQKHVDDDDEDAPRKQKKAADDEDEDAPTKPVHHKTKRSDDDEEDAPKKPAKKVVAKKASDDDEDDAPKKPAKKVVAKKASDDDEDDAPKKPVKKPVKKSVKKSDDDEEDDAPKKPAPKVAAKKPIEDDEPKITDDEDEPVAKPKPVAIKPKAKPKAEPKAVDDEDEPVAKPKPVAIKVKAKPKADDEEVVAKPPAKHVEEPVVEEPPKKQRSIEEDIAIDDPLATAPPTRVAAAEEEEDTSEGGSATTVAAVAAPVGPTLTDRALTTPAGQIDLHAGLPINVLTTTDAMGVSSSSTSEGLALGLAYGFNAKAEVGFDYTLGLNPGAIKGPFTVHGAYSFAHGKLDFAGAAALGIDFFDTVDSMSMTTSTQTAASLQLGAWIRYHATPTVSIFSGLPGLPNASASLSKLAFALPVLSYQIQIGLSDRGTTAITLPIGLGYQASPKLYTFASLNLANIRIANTSNAFLFKDYIPIAIGGFYTMDTLSLGASFADDLKQGFGYLRFELIARYLLH